jgi:hypothetical protein
LDIGNHHATKDTTPQRTHIDVALGSLPLRNGAANFFVSGPRECRIQTSRHGWFALAEKVRNPPMLLKKSLLQRGKSFDSLDYEGIGGFRHDGHPNGTGTVVL